MIIYVIESYNEGKREDLFVTSVKERLYKEIGECIENNFNEDFDVMGYKIPEEIVDKYKTPQRIYENYLLDENVNTGDLIVFGTTFKKTFICCSDKDDNTKMERVCIIPPEELTYFKEASAM